MSSESSFADLVSGNLQGVTRLDLSCGLTEFPREIFDLSDTLEVLNLSGNRLSDLPDDLSRLKKLRILFCSANDFRNVPPVIGGCKQLEMVAFKSNVIETVAEGAFPESLRWLILTDNRIGRLPSSLGKCLRLQKLMLAGNRLEELPEEMAACVNLELIRLAANRFRSLPDWLFELPRLSWLAFAGNPLCGEPKVAGDVKIDWADLQLKELLGEGASGVIHKAAWRTDGKIREVAVKIFKGTITSDGMPADEMAASLAAGGHPQLIPIIGEIAGHPANAGGLVMELIASDFASLASPPSFDSCTRDVYAEKARFAPGVLLQIARSMAAAGAALHAKGIMHGDFYAHNVLRTPAGNSLLGDFGAASFHPADGAVPEGALERIEVRAFGCLLEELLERCEIEEYPRADFLQALLVRCLAEDRRKRPLFSEIARDLEEIHGGT